jgi:hypothetical protein
MASVFLKPKSPYWFALFKDHQGRWRNKSTKTTNKTQARKIAETFERVAARKLGAQKAAEAIRELYHELSGVEAPKATVSEFCRTGCEPRPRKSSAPPRFRHTKTPLINSSKPLESGQGRISAIWGGPTSSRSEII